MSNSNVLEIKTVQIAPFRTLMTALKDILLETNITFQPDGIRIVNMDKSHTILAYLFLDAKKFEHYYCKYPKIVIGVNMFHLFKLINSIDNDGRGEGYDIELINQVANSVSIPVIACGGVGDWSHLSEALDKTKADAVAAANIFHYIDQSVFLAKKHLYVGGYNVRKPDLIKL